MGTRHGSLEENIATARALKPLAGSQTLVPDPDCNWPIRAALLRLIPVLCFRQPHPRAGDQGGTGSAMAEEGAPVMVVSTHLVLLTVHAILVTCSTSHLRKRMDWPGCSKECWNEVISFGFILQGSWGVKATRNNGLDSSLSYFRRGIFMLDHFALDVTVYKLPSSILPIPNPAEIPLAHPSHRFRSPSNHGVSKPGHIS
ncbi:hypothetical protein BO83DRAFT_398452 [Aspergillus eucalypticola CBS 122712]|uniref:Uncharacterized protein n=1 Tax=Aspergillus eucalypticola (strain CBS 122712 / IBT 29274) TaxID=1448314 RepID=A0A317VJB5_ASPEC|nr:uncharacterized protein BO83DRAFT_398452 [Aspergillus eucalypticola CBS 122712]PWY74015.1 hypothetical protein BO83DRAFT_398452 [Aspergillus eucalypticola CBS 122712]